MERFIKIMLAVGTILSCIIGLGLLCLVFLGVIWGIRFIGGVI